MATETDIDLLRHQAQLCRLPWEYKDVGFFFLIGGYSSAKSFSDVALILKIADYYKGHRVTVGLGSISITFFLKTIGADLDRILEISKIKYHFDGQKNCYTIGTVRFYIIPIELPKNIFGYNYSIFIEDEGDELEQEKCIQAFGAIKERCRVPLPAVTEEEKKYQALYKERMKIIPRKEWDKDPQILEWKALAHRKPFSVFTTTAQGLKGIYRITEMLKEKEMPYILIRALTKDNIYNDPSYYEDLYRLYNENERAAFLEGKFVSLTAGRVYPSYDETLHTVEDFPISKQDEIIIGQDFNMSASCGTCYIKRDKVLYIVKEFQFKDYGKAPQEYRQTFPNNRIILYPDATAKMLISAYVADFEQHGIEVRMSTVNPAIQERIFLTNKGLDIGILKRFKSCKNIDMAWKTRIYDDNQMPQKSKVHPAPDDYCDGAEYGYFRQVADDPDFYHLYSLSRSFKTSG